ncbi:hypothetical protein BDV25DRAFT_152718 [Aspergillus avenaceus]|uniref:Uncharacterized protein n=1 Tax=Aspergillus avenaceus TaxID=36643 RepID=A0A5N6TYI0_ASPAV|nr:hypothetical protein BDV25DRAFT_152718 [Aspergillus avenaceus]
MADPAADAPIDEFAQTRGGDDLFDDEIIPVAAEAHVPPEVQALEENVATLTLDTQSPPTHTEQSSRSRGGEKRGRGRGKGRGRRASHSSGSKRGDGAPRTKSADETAQTEKKSEDSATPEVTEESKKEDATTDPKPSAEANGPRVPAVRGDRSATGGLKKPKLTEEELSRRIAAARENAAKVAAAHARAEADQASFLEREKVAEEKRRQERQHRRVMDNERERNRQRKLHALGGREWDSQKQEEDYNPRGGRGQFRRGMHGGVSGYVRRDFGDSQPGEETNGHIHHNHRGRGRGGRGGRGRNGRGPRDASGPDSTPNDSSTEHKPASTPVINNENEFPALPGSTNKKEGAGETTDSLDKIETSLSPVSAGTTWAEQVENN